MKKYHRSGFSLPLLLALCFFPVALTGSGPALAQKDVNSRLSRIENEIQTLSRAVFRGEQPEQGIPLPPGYDSGTTDAALRLQQIEMELQGITGKIEEQNFQIQQLQNRLDLIEADRAAQAAIPPQPLGYQNDVTLPADGSTMPSPQADQGTAMPGAEGEGFLTQGEESVPEPGQLGTLRGPDTATAADDPAGLYETAFSLLRDKNYVQAEEIFQDFLTRYPDHDLSANARYWLGETFYVRGDFEHAARVFAEGYQKHPDGAKAPDNLLKLGMSLAGMGKKDDACLAYAQLRKDYPNGAMPVLARTESEMKKLSCPE